MCMHLFKPNFFCQVTYLDCAAFAEDDSHTIHVDHHSPDVGNLLITSSVLILGVHGEVRQVRRNVAGFGQGIGASSHVMVGAFIEGGVVRVTGYCADTSSWTRKVRVQCEESVLCTVCFHTGGLYLPQINQDLPQHS